jgi:RNA polymerase sigma-70 factor (ECF subfamily)
MARRKCDVSHDDWLAGQFESHRGHLRAVAYRMLGSLSEADDAVQEAWLRLHRAGGDSIDNLGGWLTTTVARVCLDTLRARKARRETEPQHGTATTESAKLTENAASAAAPGAPADPEQEAMLADSVGLAMLVVLESLEPAERVAFVLHDLFGVAFEDIAAIVGRSSEAARQLASRARRRLRGETQVPREALARQREVVGAFLAASRDGDFDKLLSLLDPQVVFRPDLTAKLGGPRQEVRGAAEVAKLFSGRAQAARIALVNGEIGIVVAPRGHLLLALVPTVASGRIVALDVVAAPDRLRELQLGVAPEPDSVSGSD